MHFNHLKRTVAIINILTISLGHLAVPTQAWAQSNASAKPAKPASQPQSEVIKKDMVGISDDINRLTIADDSSANGSAKRPLPISVQELEKDDFKADEVVSMTINNPDKDAFTTKVINAEGQEMAVETRTVEHGNETDVLLAGTNQFVPGKFTLEVIDAKGNVTKQDFTWGVLAINTDKATYKPNETAAISMAVLDDKGDMVCDASVTLKITNSVTNATETLSTANNKIKVNKQCSSKSLSLVPDYEAEYTVGGVGSYTMELSAHTINGDYTINDGFSVKESTPFEIKRSSATRLYPPLDYPMNIEFTANQDFEGTVTETVPESFTISSTDAKSSYSDVKTVYLDGQDPEAKVLGAQAASLQMPFDGNFSITQGFGGYMTDGELRNFYAKYGLSGHDGIDFALPMGTPLYAVDDGNVVFAGPGDYGITIIIQHAWGKSYYGHLSKTDVPTETNVKKGTLIGYSGNTGESTGPHLHFGMKPENPDMSNGYAGKIDPLPYLNLAGNGMRPPALENAINSTGVLSATTSAEEEAEHHDTPGASEPTPIPSTAASSSQSAEPALEPQSQQASPSAQQHSVKSQPFTVLNQEIQNEVADSESSVTEKVKVIKWQVKLKKGEKTTLSYAYKAPLVSPQFYLLGSAKVFDASKNMVYDDTRKWQLAADAVGADWYDYNWLYRKPITIDDAQVVAPNVLFMDPGTDTHQNFTSFSSTYQLATSSTAQVKTGARSIQFNSGASDLATATTNSGVIEDTGTRLAFWLYLEDDFTGDADIVQAYNGGTFAVSLLGVDGTTNQLNFINGQAASSALSLGRWYHIAVSYYVSANAVNEFRLYIDGVQEGTVSNYSLSSGSGTVGADTLRFGILNAGTGSNKDIYMDDIYIDDGNDLSYPGDIRIAPKRPFANGASNGFSTSSGSSSGYGSGHSTLVNEIPPSTSNYWRTASANIRENFTVEGEADGYDMTGGQTVALGGWILANRASGTCTNPRITVNGNDTNVTIGTANTYVIQYARANAYPSGTQAIGTQSCTGALTYTLYAAGLWVAYTTNFPDQYHGDFPVLVSLTSDSALSSKALANGNDILFTSDDGRTKLSHQIESYSSGTLVAWVRVPKLSYIKDTTIYMYYGNNLASSQQNATGVWDSAYKAVYHMNETSGTTATDSTSNANNGTASGFTMSSNTGQIGNSQNFDGGTAGNDKITIPNSTSLQDITEQNYTYSAWASPDTNPNNTGNNDYFVVGKRGNHTGIRFASSSTWFASVYNTSNTAFAANASPFAIGSWRYLVQTVDATKSKTVNLYIDGIWRGQNTFTGTLRDYGTQASSIGQADINAACSSSFAWCFDGKIDEVRMSNKGRSDAWIATEYNNQVSPGTFYTVEPEETKIYAPTNEELMRHGKFFDSRGAEQPFVF